MPELGLALFANQGEEISKNGITSIKLTQCKFLLHGEIGKLASTCRPSYACPVDPAPTQILSFIRFPKMGLNRKYVGDQYPLCSDLPPQHFLSQGSTYRLLDSPAPELHVDPIEWRSGGEAPLVLDAGSNLYTKLAGEAPKLKVVLDQALSCTGDECSINTVRTVKVGENYYEYIRAPCVNQAFYSDAKTIAKRTNGGHAMCGDPRVESATAACCGASEGWSEKVRMIGWPFVVELLCPFLTYIFVDLVLGRANEFRHSLRSMQC